MVAVTPPPPTSVPSRVFPLPGWTGPINTHWGQGITGGSDLMVSSSGTQPVVSMVSGKVTFVSSQATAPKSGGNAVEIHGIDGLDYYYAHLASGLNLKPGDSVSAGQMLGLADSTGDAAGGPPHLHIGIGYGIQTGVGATGGTGKGFDAVAALKSLVGSPIANNPQIVSPDIQSKISTGQPIGTIQLGAPANAPISTNLSDRIKWLAQLLSAAGAPSNLIPQLVAISLAENPASDPNAPSPTNDIGLWQINIPTWAQRLGLTVDQLKDPLTNAKAAVAVLNAQGLTAWSTHNVGKDQQYLPQVQQALAGVDLGNTPLGGGAGAPGDQTCNCGTWLHTPFGDLPDMGCVLACQIGNVIEQWKQNWLNWWNSWTTTHVANWGFVIAGAILIGIGIAALIGGSSQFIQAVKVATKAGVAA